MFTENLGRGSAQKRSSFETPDKKNRTQTAFLEILTRLIHFEKKSNSVTLLLRKFVARADDGSCPKGGQRVPEVGRHLEECFLTGGQSSVGVFKFSICTSGEMLGIYFAG